MRKTNPADSQKIADAIRRSAMSQREIARSLGVSDVTVSNYATGWRKPSVDRLPVLAAVLGVQAEDLV